MNFDRWIMIFVLGWALCLNVEVSLGAGQDQRAIEVIADGQRYGSIEKYKESQRGGHNRPVWSKDQAGVPTTVAVLLRNAVSHRYTSSALTGGRFYTGLKDVEKYLSTMMGSAGREKDAEDQFDPFLEMYNRISHLGFNTGVARIVEEFTGHEGDQVRYKRLMAKDLETTLSGSFEKSHYAGPILIISHKKKVRIMTLEDEVGAQDEASNP